MTEGECQNKSLKHIAQIEKLIAALEIYQTTTRQILKSSTENKKLILNMNETLLSNNVWLPMITQTCCCLESLIRRSSWGEVTDSRRTASHDANQYRFWLAVQIEDWITVWGIQNKNTPVLRIKTTKPLNSIFYLHWR